MLHTRHTRHTHVIHTHTHTHTKLGVDRHADIKTGHGSLNDISVPIDLYRATCTLRGLSRQESNTFSLSYLETCTRHQAPGKVKSKHERWCDMYISDIDLPQWQAVVERHNKADKSQALEKELEALRERCQAAEDVSHTHKMAATEAQALASISRNKADVLGSQRAGPPLSACHPVSCPPLPRVSSVRKKPKRADEQRGWGTESETRMEELRKRVAELEKAAREALARLCKIGELEGELRSQEKLVMSAETQRHSAQSSCRIFEKQVAALLEGSDLAKSEKTKLEKDVLNGLDRESRLEAALAELRSRAAVAAIPSEVHNQVDQVCRLEKKAALQAQVHKLQVPTLPLHHTT